MAALEPAELRDGVVVLRAMTLDDVDALMAGEDADTVRWLSGQPATTESATRHIAASLEAWQANGPRRAWGVYEEASGLLAGTVEAHLALDGMAAGEANISYSVFPKFRGRRFAARAVTLVCMWLRGTDKTTAVIRVDPDNGYSKNVPFACGFIEDGPITSPDGDHLIKYVFAV